MGVKVVSDEKSKVNSRHMLNPDLYFKSRQKLSLKRGCFMLFEHLDEMPLFVNNFGMASKLKRYVLFSGKDEPSTKLFDHQTYVGPHGTIIKRPHGTIPLLG
jgi:hypothetical protein